MKTTVIGSGMVGSTFAYRLMVSGLADEIVLIDLDQERALGEAEDIASAIPVEQPCEIRAGRYADAVDSDFVVITAGLSNLKDGTRLDLCRKNAEIFKDLVPEVVKYAPSAMYVVASNPVDVMTYATIKYSGLDRTKVIGSGTVLDSDRLRQIIANVTGVSSSQVVGFTMGEHGDSQVPIFSQMRIKGIELGSFVRQRGVSFAEEQQAQAMEQVRTAAYRIISRKRATYYGIASALERIVRAIWRDEKVILPVSTMMQGDYGFEDVCIAAPTFLSREGAGQVFDISMTEAEYRCLSESVEQLKKYTSTI